MSKKQRRRVNKIKAREKAKGNAHTTPLHGPAPPAPVYKLPRHGFVTGLASILDRQDVLGPRIRDLYRNAPTAYEADLRAIMDDWTLVGHDLYLALWDTWERERRKASLKKAS